MGFFNVDKKMLTVGQAKEKGVVFVEGDVIDNITLNEEQAHEVNNYKGSNYCKVTSFTDRKHTGDGLPCDRDLPVEVALFDGCGLKTPTERVSWTYRTLVHNRDITSWKPDLEALEKLANGKEEKPMAEKQYTYELVTDLSTNEIAKSMIDGEVFYSANDKFEYKWLGNRFNFNLFNDDFYRRKEIETITRTITYPKPVSEPLNDGDEYWYISFTGVHEVGNLNKALDGKLLNQNRIHLTKENAQAHWDALFGGK